MFEEIEVKLVFWEKIYFKKNSMKIMRSWQFSREDFIVRKNSKDFFKVIVSINQQLLLFLYRWNYFLHWTLTFYDSNIFLGVNIDTIFQRLFDQKVYQNCNWKCNDKRYGNVLNLVWKEKIQINNANPIHSS